MPEPVSVGELGDTDILADLALFLTGSEEIDGITIDDATATRRGITVTFADATGATRTVDLIVTAR